MGVSMVGGLVGTLLVGAIGLAAAPGFGQEQSQQDRYQGQGWIEAYGKQDPARVRVEDEEWYDPTDWFDGDRYDYEYEDEEGGWAWEYDSAEAGPNWGFQYYGQRELSWEEDNWERDNWRRGAWVSNGDERGSTGMRRGSTESDAGSGFDIEYDEFYDYDDYYDSFDSDRDLDTSGYGDDFDAGYGYDYEYGQEYERTPRRDRFDYAPFADERHYRDGRGGDDWVAEFDREAYAVGYRAGYSDDEFELADWASDWYSSYAESYRQGYYQGFRDAFHGNSYDTRYRMGDDARGGERMDRGRMREGRTRRDGAERGATTMDRPSRDRSSGERFDRPRGDRMDRNGVNRDRPADARRGSVRERGVNADGARGEYRRGARPARSSESSRDRWAEPRGLDRRSSAGDRAAGDGWWRPDMRWDESAWQASGRRSEMRPGRGQDVVELRGFVRDAWQVRRVGGMTLFRMRMFDGSLTTVGAGPRLTEKLRELESRDIRVRGVWENVDGRRVLRLLRLAELV